VRIRPRWSAQESIPSADEARLRAVASNPDAAAHLQAQLTLVKQIVDGAIAHHPSDALTALSKSLSAQMALLRQFTPRH